MDSFKDNLNSEFPDVNLYTQSLLRSTLNAVKQSSKIPSSGEKYDLLNNFPGFRQLMRTESKHILNLMIEVLQHQGVKGSFEYADLEEKFDLLVDANDSLLERAGTALDEASGIKKKEEALVTTIKFVRPINTSWNKKMSPRSGSISLLAGKNVLRPQLRFVDKIDNSNNPFVPPIKYKPHSIKPLSILLEVNEEGIEEYSHPYEIEIEKFNPPERRLTHATPQVPRKLEETRYVFVNTSAGLMTLCTELSRESEFAIDLEAHSYRTFQGITCLMQISTRSSDYLVDVIELRHEMHQLNEVFANPAILKVLHGADLDVQWLQRDFGLYLVNMFDTGQAARVLNYSHFSLSFLLKHFCQVDPDKSFQLADWRIRPLMDKMVHYAREDTHYLLYIYDCMKNELLDKGNLQKNLLLSVYQRSQAVCLRRYRKLIFTDDSYLGLYQKSKKSFNTRQLFALKEIFSWRDKLARVEDESCGYILPNHMMLQIAEILPREQQGILACCNPIPPLVRQQLNELHLIILKAREWSEEKLLVPVNHLQSSASHLQNHLRIESRLNCPHDLPTHEEAALPTLLSDGLPKTYAFNVALKKKADLSAFTSPARTQAKTIGSSEKMRNVQQYLEQMISPFQRFTLLKSMAEVEDMKNQEAVGQQKANDDRVDRVFDHIRHLVSSESQNTSGEMEVTNSVEESTTILPGSDPPEENQEQQEAPLKNQLPKKRKRKAQRQPPDMLLNTDQPAEKKQKEFTPFDYNKAKEVLFQDYSADKTRKKQPFDPNTSTTEPKKAKQSKRNRGGKNMTYGSRFQNFTKNQWPRR